MAIIPNAYLRPDPQVTVRDPQHAARMFTDDNFRLAPKQNFLFHVTFSLNQAALRTISLAQRHRNEIGMLVKTCDLPNFALKVETVNQYNRKKNVQTGHTYNAITIKFHDDNMGLINELWQNYYSYYYADPVSAEDPAAYTRTAIKNFRHISNNYGLDNGSTLPFFNYIKIYQMARGEYVSYTLHNPLISSFNHNGLDYSSSNNHDNTMSVSYEAVSYGSGIVQPGDPEGFALEHYDLTPSPLTGTAEGLVSASPTFADKQSLIDNAPNFLSNAIESVNSYANTKPLATAGASNVISNVAGTAQQGVGGLQGIAFPIPPSANNTTVANKVKLG
jgi:hypothetical protein